MKVKYLRDVCFDDLYADVKKNYSLYKQDKIWIQDKFPNEQYFIESNLEINKFSLLVGDKKNDFNNAIIIFEALKNLTPYQATNIYLWTLLAHTDCYNYMVNRWTIDSDEITQDVLTTIRDRYFCQNTRRGIFRNGISRLWWSTYLTYNEKGNNPYKYTKLLFSEEELFVSIMERNFAMCKNVVQGLLQAIAEYKDVNDRLPSRETRRSLMKYINSLGSVTLLEMLSLDDVYIIAKEFIKTNEK